MNYIGKRIKIINVNGCNGIHEAQAYVNKMGFIIKDYEKYHRFMIHYDIDYMNVIDEFNGHALMQESNIEIIEPPKNMYGGTGNCIGFVPSNIYENWTDNQWTDYDQYRKYMGLPSRADTENAFKVISKRLREIQE